MIKLERNGNVWTTQSLDKDDVTILKDGEQIAEWVDGTYSFKGEEISEQDLMVVIDIVDQFRQRVNKRV